MMRHLRPALVSVAVWMILTGLAFPGVITGIAQVVLPRQANGSLVRRDGRIVGSALIGQSFTAARYFHPRPSAAGSGYDASNSSGTNLGPTSRKLMSDIAGFAAAYRKENGLAPDAVLPADAVTRSASGLDPEVSPANAALQVARVARARGLPEADVLALVARATELRQLGFLGEPRVNVLALNLALDAAPPARPTQPVHP
jgi:K+-transporting ATPase ATPase C chain